jgi:hypothetical protein
MNQNIITANDLMAIHGFKSLEQVDSFFVKYGIRPFYSPSGHPFVMVDTLTEAQRAELKFENEAV